MKMTKILYAGLVLSNLITIAACGEPNVSETPVPTTPTVEQSQPIVESTPVVESTPEVEVAV